MLRTKRIFTLFLAVVLMFSALPFSVSAEELPGGLSTESSVGSQPEGPRQRKRKNPRLR